ncbi:TetR/AcrR family transcriptional regulator [Planobispora longispora]|uniref:TetR family transcriptional regulator n=1 Tax=Planobispora longispora TaxID=28887 RepID=A0A8J3W761_9ACTN|nr:TetR/AcrR family transcriptional regulator [Planobispora longispora]BFE80587.1 TetR/AcrR family transcriptional regulator [Planobispora longispora]GIH79249.1 TetR family transcriptional regulator [Planobispora longispora]
MGTLTNRPDRRVRRTRKAVQDALVDLILEKGYQAVTVTDVIVRADIGRSTFYSHFTGTQDVLFSTIEELVETLGGGDGERPDTPGRAFAFSLPLLEHVDEQRHLARALLGPRGDAAVRDRVQQILTSAIRAGLLCALPGDQVPPDDLDLVATCAAGAFIALLTRWTHDGTAETPAQLNAAFQALLEPVVTRMPRDARAPEDEPRCQPRTAAPRTTVSEQTALDCPVADSTARSGD